MNEVCCLTYDGESADIQADLATIQKEAGTLLHDIEHYIKHQDRLNDFQQLLNWVKLSKPLSLEEVKRCQGKFGFNLMYAVMENQLKLGGKPSTDGQIELSHASMKDKKKKYGFQILLIYHLVNFMIIRCKSNACRPNRKC